MTQGRVEVITSVERRRRWSAAEKRQLVAASLEPGASVSAIAREVGIHPGQLHGWRRAAAGSAATGFCAGTDCAGGADLYVQPGNDRDRVCRRSADADHGRGRRGDADGCGRGAGEWTAAMIPIASGVRCGLRPATPTCVAE
jgi:hypothetical protein